MAIRNLVAGIVTLYALLLAVGFLWVPFVLTFQPYVSVLIFVVLYVWIAQLEDDLDKKRESE